MRRFPRKHGRALALAAALAAGVGLAACGGGAEESAEAPGAVSAAEAGYMAPPSLTSAMRGGGRIVLGGAAPPGAAVGLLSPSGARYSAQADETGAWMLTVPTPEQPAMFAFSAQAGERTLRGDGAVMVAPAPAPPAMLLRPGYGALSLGRAPALPHVAAVDFDANGGVAVSGFARPDAPVRLSVDGGAAGLGQADPAGRFAVVAANRTLAPGPHRIDVETELGQTDVRVQVGPPADLGAQAYTVVRQAGGWRIDWAPPGGGVQTTLVFDAPDAAS